MQREKKKDMRVREAHQKKENVTVRLKGEIRVESCIYSDLFQSSR